MSASSEAGPSQPRERYTTEQCPFVPLDVLLAHLRQLSETTGPVPEWIRKTVEQRKHLLSIDNFPAPRQASKTNVNGTGGVTLAGGHKTAALDEAEKTLVIEISGKLEVDEVEALVLLKSLLLQRKGPAAFKPTDQEEYEQTEDWWDEMQIFYFQERLAIYDILNLLLRLSEPEDEQLSPGAQYCNSLISELLPAGVPVKILKTFVDLSSRDLPNAARESSRQSTFWAKQYVREEKELLDLLFFSWYLQPPSGADVKALLECINSVEWGTKQACASFWDGEAQSIGREVSCIFVAISIEALSIETIVTQDFAIPLSSQRLPVSESLLAPDTLMTIHKAIVDLAEAFPAPTSPLLMAWSFLLSRLTDSIPRGEVAREYNDFITVLLPTASNPQPIWQRLLSHSLTSCFSCILSCLPPPTATSSNMLGLLSVYRSLLALLPSMVSLAFLDQDHLALATDCAVKMYGHQEAGPLRSQFWGLDQQEENLLVESERELLDFHARRFPFQPASMLQLLRALSLPEAGDSNENRCGDTASAFLRSLPYLCCVVGSSSSMDRSYEISTGDSTMLQVVKSGKGMQITKSVWAPQYTQGRVVSTGAGREMVVQLDFTQMGWDGWNWIDDLLEDYAGTGRSHARGSQRASVSSTDPFLDQPMARESPRLHFEESDQQEQAVADALDLLSRDLVNRPANEDNHVEQRAHTLFAVLEKALSGKGARPRLITAAALTALTALLPSYPGLIWSLFRLHASTLFLSQRSFKSSAVSGGSALLRADKSAGSFGPTTSLLDMIEALLLEAQRSASADQKEHRQLKTEVLSQVMRWVNDEIWSAGWQGWKYVEGHQRWELGTRLCRLWTSVVYDASLVTGGDLRDASAPLIDSLLEDAASANSNAAIAPLVNLLHSSTQGVLVAQRAGRVLEAACVEVCARAAMSLTSQLLILRSQRSSVTSLLEVLLFEQNASQTTSNRILPDPLAALVSCTLDAQSYDCQTSILAAQTLSALISVPSSNDASTQFFSLLPSFTNPIQQLHSLLESAVDHSLDDNLRIAIWTFIDAMIQSQPALAMWLITGKLRAGTAGDSDKPDLQKTVLGTVMDLLFDTDAATSLELEAAIFRTLDNAWRHIADYPDSFDMLRSEDKFWTLVLNRATSSQVAKTPFPDVKSLLKTTAESRDTYIESSEALCHSIMARVYAIRLMTTDIEYSSHFSKMTCKAADAVGKLLGNKEKLLVASLSAVSISGVAELHSNVESYLSKTFPGFALNSCRHAAASSFPALDVLRPLGKAYVYDVPLAIMKTQPMADGLQLSPYLLQCLNIDWSFIDTQVTAARAWQALLATSYEAQIKRESSASAVLQPALACATAIADKCKEERQSGEIAASVHESRLQMLVSFVEICTRDKSFTYEQALQALNSVAALLNHDSLHPNDALQGLVKAAYHRPLLSALYLLLTHIKNSNPASSNESKSATSQSGIAIDAVLQFGLHGVRSLVLAIQSDSETPAAQSDLGLFIAVLQRAISLPISPSPRIWLLYCQEVNLYHLIFSFLSSTPSAYVANEQGSSARHLFTLCLAMAAHPQAAERLALEGVLALIYTNPLSTEIEAGQILPVDKSGKGERNDSHRIWCLMLALLSRMAAALANSDTFLNEVCGLVRYYAAQLILPLQWTMEDTLYLAVIEEMEALVGLIAILIARAPDNAASQLLVKQVLYLLNSVVYCLQHPNTLAASIEPLSHSEQEWLEQASKELSGETSIQHFSEKPVIGSIVQVFASLAASLVHCLSAYCQSFQPLRRDDIEWPFHRILFDANPMVSSQEPATVGTLMELSEWCLGVLRHHPSTTAGALAPKPAAKANLLPAYNFVTLKSTVGVMMELTLLLATSQLALALYKPQYVGEEMSDVQSKRSITSIVSKIAPDLLSNIHKASTLDTTPSTTRLLQKGKAKEGSSPLCTALKQFIRIRINQA